MSTGAVQAALVGAGGMVGALARYGLGGLVHRMAPLASFPIGTLVVNLAGCFAIGVLAGMADFQQKLGPELRTFLFIGVLGGFTTFSTFGFETVALLRDGEIGRALLNVGVQVVAGLGLVWAGYEIAATR